MKMQFSRLLMLELEMVAMFFDVQTPTEVIKICILVCQGRHNLMNALMAIAM
jgi:UDP-N-acetylmuramate-alanine ligase